MKNNENLTTVTYTINLPGFKHHVRKCIFRKNSIISKKVHPMQEIENIKQNLLSKNKLKDCGNYYLLKDDVKIGALIAYNLHCGEFKKEFDNPNPIVISSNADKNIAEEFDIKNIYSTDAIIKKGFDKNSIKLEHIYEYNIRKEFLEGASPNHFSETEQLVFDVLKEEQIISNPRHGDANKNEADIVDDSLGIQIEIVTAFKLSIRDKLRQTHDVFTLAELVSTDLVKVSKAVLKKFYEKNYTPNYEKHLALFCFGDSKSTATLLEKIKEEFNANPNIKNDFKKIYIVMYDFLNDIIQVYNGNELNKYNSSKFNVNYISKKEIHFTDLNDSEEYIFITKHILKEEFGISIQTGADFKLFAKDLQIII